MIKVRIQVGSGSVVDTETQYGLIYLDSDKRVGPEVKDFETTSYPEEEGEHIIPKTVDAPFDYKVKFFIVPDRHTSGQSPTLIQVNKIINDFNEAILPLDAETGQRTVTQVKFFNDYKGHKIVGYPKPIAEATEFWRDPNNHVNDVVIVEWTIRVTQPSLCEYTIPFTEDQPTT